MPADHVPEPAARPADPGALLRRAAPVPRAPVDVDAVLARGRILGRRRVVIRGALALLLVLPVGGVLLSLARTPTVDLAEGGGSIPASLAATETPPDALVDGTAPAEVPGAVRARFDQPVVGTARTDQIPGGAADDCATLAGDAAEPPTPDDAAGRRLRLAEAAGPPLVHVGPALAASLQLGKAPSPPAYPDTYGVVCLAGASPSGMTGALAAPGADVTHLATGWTGFSSPTGPDLPFLWVSAVEVPEGAAWAVQEQPGWWLAYDVGGAPWVLAQTAMTPDGPDAEPAFPGARVVFLDPAGRSLGEERVGTDAIHADAPFLRPQATGARIRLGDEAALRADLADGPIPVCADERTVCVWMTLADGELLALSAAGPIPAEVPPLGYVGACADGGFAASGSSSRYAGDGRWLAGPVPVGLHRYGVAVADGEVTVDLEEFAFGAERGDDPGAAPPPCADVRAPGFPMP